MCYERVSRDALSRVRVSRDALSRVRVSRDALSRVQTNIKIRHNCFSTF